MVLSGPENGQGNFGAQAAPADVPLSSTEFLGTEFWHQISGLHLDS